MKNTITLNASAGFAPDCVDSVYDKTNSLYLSFLTDRRLVVSFTGHRSMVVTPEANTIEVPQDWYINTDLALTVEEVGITIKAPESTVGSMTVAAAGDNTYQVKFYQAKAGSQVSITPTLHEGTKIADYTIDGIPGELFAPNGGGVKEVLAGTVPPVSTIGEDDNVYVEFKLKPAYKLDWTYDCGGASAGGFDLTVEKTSDDVPTAFLFNGAYQYSIPGCNLWYAKLSGLTVGDTAHISFNFQMSDDPASTKQVMNYVDTDAWYKQGIWISGVNDPTDAHIMQNVDGKVKYGWSETANFLSVNQDLDPHHYEFDYTIESSDVYIYFNWNGFKYWSGFQGPLTNIDITDFVIETDHGVIDGVAHVYYKKDGVWWLDNTQAQEVIPAGGATGQVLGKRSEADYDVEWMNQESLPAGGASGQVLGKLSGADFDVGWVNQSGGGGGSEEYSTTETKIGTWIDGKPLYRKVITVTLAHTGTYQGCYLYNYAHGIANIDTAVSVTGYLDDNGDHIMIGFYTNYGYFFSAMFNRTNANFRYNSQFDNRSCTMVLEYTKTTD